MSDSTQGGTDPTQNGEAANPAAVKLQESLNAAIAERDTLKGQLRDLKSASKSTTDVQRQYDELMTSHSKLQEAFDGYKTTVKQRSIDTHVQTALDASGAHNAARVKAMLDMSKIKIADDGTVDQPSLAEAIIVLKTSDPYLFKVEAGNDQGSQSSQSTTAGQLPSIKPAAGNKSGDAFTIELEAAKKAKDPFRAIEDVLSKYGSAIKRK